MIFQSGSEVVTYKPGANGDTDVEDLEIEGEDYAIRTTPHVRQGKADISEGPYETPVILRTKRRALPVQVDDTDSGSEIIIRKRKKGTGVSTLVTLLSHVMPVLLFHI